MQPLFIVAAVLYIYRSVSALPQTVPSFELTKRQNSSTTCDDTGCYLFEFETNGVGTVNYTDGAGGEFSVVWEDCGSFVIGKGWSTGAARTIQYGGTFNPSGNAYLSVYGWTTSPIVEYYILESYGSYDPGPSLTHKGTVSSDGGTYDIYERTVVNQPAIVGGIAVYNQYWSIRQSKRVGGTVTTANHFNAWSSLGMSLGTFNYQLVAVQGYESSGSATITIA